jgi:hypothetical protein
MSGLAPIWPQFGPNLAPILISQLYLSFLTSKRLISYHLDEAFLLLISNSVLEAALEYLSPEILMTVIRHKL